MQMKTLLLVTSLAAFAATPAPAHKPADPGAQGKAHRQAHGNHGKAKGKANRCKVHARAFIVSGAFEAASLTKNADGSYDGSVTLKVERTNTHAHAHKGTSQTYTLDDAKVRFHVPDRDASGTVDAADPRPGDRVKLHGKVTRKNRKCDQTGFTQTVKFRKVTFAEPKTQS